LSAVAANPFPGWEWSVTKKSSRWQEALKTASLETNPKKKRALCEEARQILQQQLIITGGKGHSTEERSIEEALRQIWVLEQQIDRRSKRGRRKSDRPPQK
jgi:hypothetical protein